MCHLSANQKGGQFRLSEIRLDLDFGKSEIATSMEPAKSIIAKFARPDEGLTGEAVVSKVTETAYTAPYRWQQPRAKGGTDGLIPQRHHPKLLNYAKEQGIDLTPGEFLPCQQGEVECV